MVMDGDDPEAMSLRCDSPAGTQESHEREVAELREQVRSLKTQLKRERRFGLVWEDKPEDVVTRCQSEYPVLVEVPDRAVTPPALFDAPTNYLIEGDNYPALAALNCTHAGAIDLIYIDPPYNTGNKDFTYNDHYVDAEDSYRHSKWLSFMEKRLRLAWSLLSPRGALFISIDDDEHAHLKLLCDAVCGPTAFISNIIWQKKYTQANDPEHFSDTHDFILCYAKPEFSTGRLRRTEKQKGRYTNPDNDPRGHWKAAPLHARSGTDDTFAFTFKNGITWSPPLGTFPRFAPENLRVADEEGRIWFGAKGDAIPSIKRYLAEMADEVVPTTIWLHTDAGHNDEARRELKEHFPNNPFSTPKPTRLIKRILELASTA